MESSACLYEKTVFYILPEIKSKKDELGYKELGIFSKTTTSFIRIAVYTQANIQGLIATSFAKRFGRRKYTTRVYQN